MRPSGDYRTIRECYEFLSGTVRGWDERPLTPTDQCFCNTYNRCYPEQLCGDCNLDKSGMCQQDSGDSSIPGV